MFLLEVSEARCGGSSPGGDSPVRNGEQVDKEDGESGIDANSQGSCSSNDVKSKEKRKDKKKKRSSSIAGGAGCSKSGDKDCSSAVSPPAVDSAVSRTASKPCDVQALAETKDKRGRGETDITTSHSASQAPSESSGNAVSGCKLSSRGVLPGERKLKGHLVFEASRPHPAEREDFEATGNETYIPATKGKKTYM
jgi:ankyrin repeat domain-containing protein 17